MTEPKDLFPQIQEKPASSKNQESEVILLTKLATGSATHLSTEFPEEDLSPLFHTLRPATDTVDPFQVPDESEPVLLLEKHTPQVDHRAPQLFPIESNSSSVEHSSVPSPEEDVSPEEDILRHMSQELFAAGYIPHPLEASPTSPPRAAQSTSSWNSSFSSERSILSYDERDTETSHVTRPPDFELPPSTPNPFSQTRPNLSLLTQTIDDSLHTSDSSSASWTETLNEKNPTHSTEQSFSEIHTQDLEVDSHPHEHTSTLSLDDVLNELILHCGRVCILSLQSHAFHGLQARGPHHIEHHIHSIFFPEQLSPTLSHVIQTQTPYIGPVPENASDQIFMASLKGPIPSRLAIFPIIQQNHTVAVYVLDDLESTQFLEQPQHIEHWIQLASKLDYSWKMPDLQTLFKHYQTAL